jgi:prepilin-type N-terminal cleavage/methylation domain-containing protein
MNTGVSGTGFHDARRKFIFTHDGFFHPRGFSLLEIMIALFIIGTVLTVIIHTVNYQSGVSYDNTVTTHMFQIAKEKLTEMETDPVNSKGAVRGTGFFFVTTAREVDGTGLMEITSVVSNNEKEISLDELIVRK